MGQSLPQDVLESCDFGQKNTPGGHFMQNINQKTVERRVEGLAEYPVQVKIVPPAEQ
jgi:hypothetical protein